MPGPASPSTPQFTVQAYSGATGRKHAECTVLFATIRYAVRKEGISIRAAERRFHVHRRTIHQALTSPEPLPRKKITRESYALNGLHGHIDAILQAESDIAAGDVWERLIDEH
jgi:hypothetical protein